VDVLSSRILLQPADLGRSLRFYCDVLGLAVCLLRAARGADRRVVGRAHARVVHLQRQAFSLFTQHPTRIAALPADLRPAAQEGGKDTVYLKDVDPAVAEEA